MTVKNSKDITLVAVTVLSILLGAVECEDSAIANFTKSSDPGSSHGLDRIKLLASLEKQNSRPAVQLNEHRKPDEKMEGQEQFHAEDESESLTNIHDDNSKAADESERKAISHEVELRANASSSAESAAGHPSSIHPLFADRHPGDPSGDALLVNRNSNNSSEIVHEHVEKYHLHQSSEEDESFKTPISGGVHGKIPDSVVVSSDSFPVRLGPTNIRVPGNRNGNNNNNNGILAINKPIPVVRHEAVHHQTDVSENHDNLHDRYIS